MRIHLVFVGKTGFRDLESAIGRYVERLGHYCPVRVHYVKAEKITPGMNEDTVRLREGERIAKLVNRQGRLVVLDQGGSDLDSPGLARFMRKHLESGVSEMWIAVGGPVGVSRELLKSADSVISLSKMTFAHDLARLVLVEQLYRAFTILRGEPYHK
ncbi:MAG: 23S rRNA (pseudouridine(1915)-N(3))-methyltransferase RlmH [Syntrophobacteraceae bacterium]